MEIEIKYLKSNSYPNKKIYNQIVRLHKPNGGINVATWKFCTMIAAALKKKENVFSVKEPYNADMFFDEYYDHYTFYIRDKKTKKILSWALVVLGKFKYDDELNASIQFYSRPNIRGQGLGSAMFKEAIRIADIENVKNCFYYPSNDNKWFFHKMKKYVPKNIIMQNVYRDLSSHVKKIKAKKAAEEIYYF